MRDKAHFVAAMVFSSTAGILSINHPYMAVMAFLLAAYCFVVAFVGGR